MFGMNLWELPTSVTANGHEYPIRTDYRAVLDVLTALSDKDMTGDTPAETNYIQSEIIRQIMFEDPDSILDEDLEDAFKGVAEFIDMGIEKMDKPSPRVMDWEQDATLIIPAVNRVVGREIRADKYMHWWTFLSAYMEIGECTFTHILSIRQKRATGKKLEKCEQDYIRDNKDVVLLKDKLTEQEKREREEDEKALKELLG